MSLGQASKHFLYLKQEAEWLFESFKSGDQINILTWLKDLFFDITFHIIFGDNDYSKFDKVMYKNPHDNSPSALKDIKPTILKIMDDAMKQGMKPLFVFFPKLMKDGYGSQKYLHQNAASIITSLSKFASNNQQINPHSILN